MMSVIHGSNGSCKWIVRSMYRWIPNRKVSGPGIDSRLGPSAATIAK